MTLATILSFSRVVLILPIIFFCFNESFSFNIFGIIVYIFAALTDFFDGYIARKTGTDSQIGAMNDLIADKIFVCVLLIWIVYFYDDISIFIASTLIVSRELILSAMRQHLSSLGYKGLEVKKSGKIKTTVQMISIGFLLLGHLNSLIFEIGLFLLFSALFLSYWSLYIYFSQMTDQKEKL